MNGQFNTKALLALWTAFVLFGLRSPTFAQDKPWLTDEQAREVAAKAVYSKYPEPCYSTYRDERLEGILLSVRKNPIVGNRLNDSVYFYHLASDSCDYVVMEEGKPSLRTQITMDCCEYGMVAVDRATAKSYWFTRNPKPRVIFEGFVHDEQLRPDLPEPTLFVLLYEELVWSHDLGIESLEQLHDMAQSNFRSAYILDKNETRWQGKFAAWWRKFRSRTPQLKLETTYETTTEGMVVRGYGFAGFVLSTPPTDPPPKGAPKLFQWSLLVKADGTVEELPTKVVYSGR